MKSRTWSSLAIVVALLSVAMPATSAELLDEHLVVVSIKSRDDADAFREALDRTLVLLRESSTGSLADAKIEVLREKSSTTWWAKPLVTSSDLLRSHFGMEQLLKLPGNREQREKLPADFELPRYPAIDHLLLIGLPASPDPAQIELLRGLRDELAGAAEVGISLSKRYLIYESRKPTKRDDRLVFVVPWRIGEEDGLRTQQYWRDEHGPLAHRLIVEHGQHELKRYEQIQTDRARALDPFGAPYQGLAMQYIDSMGGALGSTLTNLESTCTNTELAVDELNFTQGPSLLFFEDISAEALGLPH